jgi:purine nucleosidase
VALDPSSMTSQSEHYMDVETDSELTRGMTVVDRLNVAANERNRDVWAPVLGGRHQAKIVWTIDNLRWKHALDVALQ